MRLFVLVGRRDGRLVAPCHTCGTKSSTEMSQPGLQLKAASASAESHPIPGSILKLNFWLRQTDT